MRDARALERLGGRDDPTSRRLPVGWKRRARAWAARDYPLGLQPYHGLFISGLVGEWRTLEDLLILVADEPAAVARLMERLADLAVGLIDRTRADVEFDYLHLSEPIASNAGPVIGPETYGRLVLPALRRIVEHARARGIDLIHVVPGEPEAPHSAVGRGRGQRALGLGHGAGRGGLHAAPPNVRPLAGVDWRPGRARPHPRRGGHRGPDHGEVPPLLAEGGYIPSVDGRVREYVPFERYAFDRRPPTKWPPGLCRGAIHRARGPGSPSSLQTRLASSSLKPNLPTITRMVSSHVARTPLRFSRSSSHIRGFHWM